MIAHAIVGAAFNPWRSGGRYRFGYAGLLSVVLHAAVALFVMSVVMRTPLATVPVRVSLREPAPPPPPGAIQTSPVHEAIAEPELVVRPSQRVPKAVPRVRKQSLPEVQPQLPAEPATGAPQASGDGTAGGVVGGVRGASGSAPVPADQLATAVVPISKVTPHYPLAARSRGIEGQVVLEAILAPDGRVEPDITVVESVPLLDDAAIAAMRQWRFKPVRDRDGTPLRVLLRLPFRFVLR